MAGKRTEMSKIKQILLLHKDGMSNRKIGERLGLYKETVNKYVNAAKSDSKSIEELIKMEEPELQHRFSAGNAAYSDKRFDALQEDCNRKSGIHQNRQRGYIKNCNNRTSETVTTVHQKR